jgi:hypothetical protein
MTSATYSSSIAVNCAWTLTFTEPPPDADEGGAGVREPRRPRPSPLPPAAAYADEGQNFELRSYDTVINWVLARV